MDGCVTCDLCEVMPDGSAYCALYDETVDEDGCCDDYRQASDGGGYDG